MEREKYSLGEEKRQLEKNGNKRSIPERNEKEY